jgi:hypothetical protein
LPRDDFPMMPRVAQRLAAQMLGERHTLVVIGQLFGVLERQDEEVA